MSMLANRDEFVVVLERNTEGYEGRYHSGLKLPHFFADKSAQTPTELSQMRKEIRRRYDEALIDLASAMMSNRITVS